jgi:hypothetical protein
MVNGLPTLRCLPPSEKESGVTLRIPMMTGVVLRRSDRAIGISDDSIDLEAVEDFLFEERLRQSVKGADVP